MLKYGILVRLKIVLGVDQVVDGYVSVGNVRINQVKV